MPLVESKFPVNAFLNNGHLQTLYPYFFRKIPKVQLHRYRIDLKDGDFIDADHLSQGSDELVVLSHGLEGSSNTGYIRGMAKHLGENNNYDIIAWNMRSCSGEINRKDRFYHAASCGDLNAVLEVALTKKKYKKLHTYKYMPNVIIYKSGSQYKMQVDGVSRDVGVIRLK